jgi:hypothetical protein
MRQIGEHLTDYFKILGTQYGKISMSAFWREEFGGGG